MPRGNTHQDEDAFSDTFKQLLGEDDPSDHTNALLNESFGASEKKPQQQTERPKYKSSVFNHLSPSN